MPDAASISLLRDLALYTGLACAVGILGYRLMRHYRPAVAWNNEGLVTSRPYGTPDLILLATLGLVYITLAMQPPAGEAADAGVTTTGLIASMIITLMVCAALLTYLSRIRNLNPAELFGFQKVHWPRILKVVVIFAAVSLVVVFAVAYLVSLWLENIFPEAKPQEIVQAFQDSGSFAVKFLIIVNAVIVAPLAEEILFRGFVYGVMKRYTDAPFAAVTSSLMFAIIHMNVGSLAPLCVLAFLFCIAYEITGCLLAPMLLHMIFNSSNILLMLTSAAPVAGSP